MSKLQRDLRTLEIPDDVTVAALRAMTPAQRLAVAFDCQRTWRLRLRAHLQSRYPDWTEAMFEAEIARRALRGTS